MSIEGSRRVVVWLSALALLAVLCVPAGLAAPMGSQAQKACPNVKAKQWVVNGPEGVKKGTTYALFTYGSMSCPTAAGWTRKMAGQNVGAKTYAGYRYALNGPKGAVCLARTDKNGHAVDVACMKGSKNGPVLFHFFASS